MPPDQLRPHAAEPRHRGRDLLGATIAVLGVVLMLYGAFATAFALGCMVLGAVFIGSGAVLAYEPPADRHEQPVR